ncbi:MAG: Ribosomal protein S12 methylthiotransferase RimO [Deltaproteobacteria bacterium ADurb.Bin510]|nr:MAG: Ribosomal protein S12 methylthiotransferase RimO [Deltaproteobacteria bacterium ADurb.Bin510]
MPVQHVNDAVLKLMGRKGGAAAVRQKVAMVRERGIWLRSTVMVGHPGEDQAAFEELLDFVEEGHFDHLGAFTFSAEEGTRSAALGDGIAPEVKQERYERIMAAQQAVSERKLKSLKGRRFKTLVEGYHPETELLLRGRTEFQAPEIDGLMVINEGGADAGTFATVEVTGSMQYDLVGRIV